MSEIAKCPLCGKDVKKSIWRPEYEGCADSVVVTIKCCGMEALTIELWNRYTAAMEYAMKTAYWFGLPDGIHHPDNARAEKAMTDAETRVLEVFGK